VSGLEQQLASKSEPVHILSQGQFMYFDTVISEKNNKIGLTVGPEDMVFLD